MQIFYHIKSLQDFLQQNNKTIALVPTMGGLHAGHLSLINIARDTAELVVVSIFVNPTQFGANEDYSTYPRDIKQDLAVLEQHTGVDAVFLPAVDEMYPQDFVFQYQVGALSHILCGKSRPTHFQGVAQVVFRLFDIVRPNVAIFGKKDYQQLIIIQQMVKDLALPVEVVGSDIVRDEYGLALSTRNQYLTDDELAVARTLNTTLATIEYYDSIEKGLKEIVNTLNATFTLDYCVVLDAKDLSKINTTTRECIILAAVKIGNARLIDNFIFRKKNV